jgi:hypothetical protein
MSQKDWLKMGRAVAAISLVLVLALGGRALAGVEIVSDQPAATLLLPYFEVNLTNPSARLRCSRSTTRRPRRCSPTWSSGATFRYRCSSSMST